MGLRRGGPPEAHRAIQELIILDAKRNDANTLDDGRSDTHLGGTNRAAQGTPENSLSSAVQRLEAALKLLQLRVGGRSSEYSTAEALIFEAPGPELVDYLRRNAGSPQNPEAPTKLLAPALLNPTRFFHQLSLMCTKSSQQLFLCTKRKKSASRSLLINLYTPFYAHCQTHPLHL